MSFPDDLHDLCDVHDFSQCSRSELAERYHGTRIDDNFGEGSDTDRYFLGDDGDDSSEFDEWY